MDKDFLNARLKEIIDMPDSNTKVDLLRKAAIDFWRNGFLTQGIEFNKQALTLALSLNYKNGIAQSYAFIGYTAIDMKTAVKYYYKSLEIFEEIDHFNGIVSFYNNMGLVYKKNKNYDLALNYFFKAIKLKEEKNLGNKEIAYTNIANCYYELKFYDESLKYHRKALEMCLRNNDYARAGYEYCNIADVLFDNQQYHEALDCIETAENINKNSNHVSLNGIILYNKGRIFHSLGFLDSAAELLIKSLGIIRNTEHYTSKLKILSELITVYRKKSDYQTALYYSDEYIKEKEYLTTQEISSEIKTYIELNDYEKKQLEIQKKEEEIKRVKTIGDFTFGISEKINQPLTTLLLKMDHLRLKASRNTFSSINDYLEDLDLIYKQALKIDVMLKKIQNQVKLDSETEFKSCFVKDIINRSISRYYQFIDLNHIRLYIHLPEDDVVVISVESYLEKIMHNILKNAIESVRMAFITHKFIEINLFLRNGQWVIKIMDSGGGIDEDEFSDLFNPFYTQSKDNESVGLGLTITKTLCDALGIKIEIENVKSETFSILLILPEYDLKMEKQES